MGVPLRIMGGPHRQNLYFVAKDVCVLIHTRKGNVAKSIGQFSETQKARMPVLCVRGNGTVSHSHPHCTDGRGGPSPAVSFTLSTGTRKC